MRIIRTPSNVKHHYTTSTSIERNHPNTLLANILHVTHNVVVGKFTRKPKMPSNIILRHLTITYD